MEFQILCDTLHSENEVQYLFVMHNNFRAKRCAELRHCESLLMYNSTQYSLEPSPRIRFEKGHDCFDPTSVRTVKLIKYIENRVY